MLGMLLGISQVSMGQIIPPETPPQEPPPPDVPITGIELLLGLGGLLGAKKYYDFRKKDSGR